LTAQHFLNIWLKIIGISGVFTLLFLFFGTPILDADSEENGNPITFIVYLTFIKIAINFAFLLPMLVIVVNSMYYFEKGTITKEANFKKVKLVFIITMILTALITLIYIEDVLTTILLMGMNTIMGIILLNRFWSKYEWGRN
jgi:hypothetical protein